MKFTAEDGTQFDTAKDCRDYERAHQGDAMLNRLVGLTGDQLKAGLSYEDKDLAKAIEAAGRKCYEARAAAGDVRQRAPKPESEGAPTSEAADVPVAAADAPVESDAPAADKPARKKAA